MVLFAFDGAVEPEIGFRVDVGVGEPAGHADSLPNGVEPDSIIAPDAQDFLVGRLSTPLQFAEHLNRAFYRRIPSRGRESDPRDR